MAPMRPRTASVGLCLFVAFLPLGSDPAAAEELRLDGVRLEEVLPGSAARRLFVRLHNPHDGTVSRLAFSVRRDGVEIPVYRDLVLLDEIPGGDTAEIELYRLTEPGPVEVELREAWTVEVVESAITSATASATAATERRQRPLDPVPGLPSSVSSEEPSTAGALP